LDVALCLWVSCCLKHIYLIKQDHSAAGCACS
jgi:hypothetical protein